MTKKESKKEFYIWEGVYRTFKDAPTVGPGFSSDTWASKSLANMARVLRLTKKKRAIPEFVVYRESLLPVLGALIPKSKMLEIIDFGGNLGQEFISILHATNIDPKKIRYTVVEQKDMCDIGNKLFRHDRRIRFRPSLPSPRNSVDIIHIGSTLQYIENWKGLFKALVEFKPTYILFTDLQAGNIPTYATLQNYYDSKIPAWFFNIFEIIKEFNNLGYRLISQSTFRGSFFGKEQDRPQANLPKKFRLKNSCNLLFKKVD